MTEVKERPILFSGEMVRAILDGRKTQTRRVVKPQPECRENAAIPGHFGTFFKGWNLDHPFFTVGSILQYCPYGAPGDRLWAREAFSIYPHPVLPDTVHYRADYGDTDKTFIYKPSIHMPRWASRILLEVTNVRIERLQSISEEDAVAEGIETIGMGHYKNYLHPCDDEKGGGWLTARASFYSLWESINGEGSWDANPWVWVVEFQRVEGSSDG